MRFERHLETISTASADIELFLVPWDTEVFGFPVAQLERVTLKRDGDHAAAKSALQAWFSRLDIRLASCRLPSDSLRESMLLEDIGFRFVEMVYRPTLTPLPSLRTGDDGIVVSAASSDDSLDVESIAASAFTSGRYFLDWRLEREASNRRYREWVRRSFVDTRQQVLKGTLGDDLIGFFVVELSPDHSAYWHLTALSPAWQGKRLGLGLWQAVLALHRAEGIERVVTTISAHNVSVMNIYARLGFRFEAPQATFHWVRD